MLEVQQSLPEPPVPPFPGPKDPYPPPVETYEGVKDELAPDVPSFPGPNGPPAPPPPTTTVLGPVEIVI